MRLDSWVVKVRNEYGEVLYWHTPKRLDDAVKLYNKHIDDATEKIKHLPSGLGIQRSFGSTGNINSAYIETTLKLWNNDVRLAYRLVRGFIFSSRIHNTSIDMMHESIS